MTPFTPEPLAARLARYEAARLEHLDRANRAFKPETKAYWFGQAALVAAFIGGMQETALMVGVSIYPKAKKSRKAKR